MRQKDPDGPKAQLDQVDSVHLESLVQPPLCPNTSVGLYTYIIMIKYNLPQNVIVAQVASAKTVWNIFETVNFRSLEMR